MRPELETKIKHALDEEFVGNFLFSEEEENIILDEASKIFRKVCFERGKTLHYFDYPLIFVALVIATKRRENDESKLFENIYRYLLGRQSVEDIPTQKAYNEICKVINHFETQKEIFVLSCFKKKYYATILGHSFCPLISINSFIDLCWLIYNEDLDQNYVDNDPVLDILTSSMQNKFGVKDSDNDEDIQLGSRVYSLRAGIKGLIFSRPDLLKTLLNDVLLGINSKFNSIPYNQNKYLKILISNWWKIKEESLGNVIKSRKPRSQNIALSYSQIKVKYIFSETGINLFIPSIRLGENFDYSPIITISNNGNLILQEELSMYGSGVIMTTRSKEYPLTSLLKDAFNALQVKITHLDKVIYDSKESLHRDFILFSGSKEVLSDECLPGTYFLYTTDFSLINHYPEDIGSSGNQNISCVNTKEGEKLQSANRTIFFVSDNTNRDVYFIAQTKSEIKYLHNDEEYKIIDGELYLDMSPKIKPNSIGLRVDGQLLKLTNFHSFEYNGRIRYEVGALCDAGQSQKLKVFRYDDNLIVCAANFIKFNNITLKYDKDIYYDNDKGTVIFQTNKYYSKTDFNSSDYEVAIPFKDGELIVNPPILKRRINEGTWHSRPRANDTWYKSAYNNGSILEIDIPKGKNYLVGFNHKSIEADSNNKYKVGEHIYSYKAGLIENVTLFVRTDERCFLIDRIQFKEKFLEEPIEVNSEIKTIYWEPKFFIGESNSAFTLKISRNEQAIYESRLSSNSKSYTMNFEDGKYLVEVILNKRNIFKREDVVMFSKTFVFGSEKTFKYKNKRLKIEMSMYFERANYSRIRPIYIDNIEYLGESENASIYSGRLCLYKNATGTYIPLDYMYNEKSERIRVNPIRVEKKTESSAYLGYGLVDGDKDFEYDGEFTIEDDGMLSIATKKNGERCKSVDFFKLEVK